jgi:hypothetical protein
MVDMYSKTTGKHYSLILFKLYYLEDVYPTGLCHRFRYCWAFSRSYTFLHYT